LECTSQRFQSFHSRPVEAASAVQSIAVRIVVVPIAIVVRIVVSCVGVATAIVVVSAIFRARFVVFSVLFRTRGSYGADIFIGGRDARVVLMILVRLRAEDLARVLRNLMLWAGALGRLSVFVVLVDVPVVVVVGKFVEIAAISAGTRDIRSDLGVAALPLRRRAIRPLIRRTPSGHRREPRRWAGRVANRIATTTRVAHRQGRAVLTRLGRVGWCGCWCGSGGNGSLVGSRLREILRMVDMVLVTNKIAVSHVMRLVAVVLVLVCAMRWISLGRAGSQLVLTLLTRATLLEPSSGLALLRLGKVMIALRLWEVLVAVSVVTRVLSLLRLFKIVWDRCRFRNCGRMGGTPLRLGDRLALRAKDVLHELGSRFEGFAAIDTVDGFSSNLPLGRRLKGLRFVRLVNRSHRGIARKRLALRALVVLMLRVYFWSSGAEKMAAVGWKDEGPS
jgi:hypothetical protein